MLGITTLLSLFSGALGSYHSNWIGRAPAIPQLHNASPSLSLSIRDAISLTGSSPSSTPSPRHPTQAYCTPNKDTNMCAMGVGVRNPTQFYNQISQDTEIDLSFWDSKCQPLGQPVNFTMNQKFPLAGAYFPNRGNITISADIPPASYQHCHDETGLGEGSYVTCASKGWAEFPCGCTQLDESKYGGICELTLYDKCILKPGYIQFNATSDKGDVSRYGSTLSVVTKVDQHDTCNCDRKYFNDCPKEYVFCCGCEFRCEAS